MSADVIYAHLEAADLAQVTREIATEHDVLVVDMLERHRHAPVVAARYALWRLMVQERGYSQSAVARMFGVDHTTVGYALHGKKSRNERRALTA